MYRIADIKYLNIRTFGYFKYSCSFYNSAATYCDIKTKVTSIASSFPRSIKDKNHVGRRKCKCLMEDERKDEGKMEVDSGELSSNCRERLIILLLLSLPLFPRSVSRCTCVRVPFIGRWKLVNCRSWALAREHDLCLPPSLRPWKLQPVFGDISTFREQTRVLTFAF